MTSASDPAWDPDPDQAIPRLLAEQGPKVFALARRICGDAHEAEDLLQEVFLQAYRDWRQFEGRADPLVWLYTIARRTCQRMHRRRQGEPRELGSLHELLPFGDPELAVVPGRSAPLSELAQRELQDSLAGAVASLPEDFRMPLILKDIIGFSLQEVAEVLGVPVATIKTRVHRARLKLRQALEEGLPKAALPPPAYSEQVCLDLLQAKQDSLDHGRPMPNADAIICERCAAVFDTLDLTQELCRRLAAEDLPEGMRARLLARVRAADS